MGSVLTSKTCLLSTKCLLVSHLVSQSGGSPQLGPVVCNAVRKPFSKRGIPGPLTLQGLVLDIDGLGQETRNSNALAMELCLFLINPLIYSGLKLVIILNFNSSPPGQNGRHFTDGIFKDIFVNEKSRMLIQISLRFVSKDPIDNKSSLVQVMAWRQPGDKPFPEPMLTKFPDTYMHH